ncbi:hypothetical protein JCM10207_007707 [Rhodosporidiobolus poonsookiae]
MRPAGSECFPPIVLHSPCNATPPSYADICSSLSPAPLAEHTSLRSSFQDFQGPPVATAGSSSPQLLPHLTYKPVRYLPHAAASRLPVLVATETFAERLVRWYDPQIPLTGVVYSSEPPPWSEWLESYYRIYHPETWRILDADHNMDKAYYLGMCAWRRQRERQGASTEEIERIRQETVAAARSLLERFKKLYGLHFVREQYLAHFRIEKPSDLPVAEWDAHVLQALEAEDLPMCRLPKHSAPRASS